MRSEDITNCDILYRKKVMVDADLAVVLYNLPSVIRHLPSVICPPGLKDRCPHSKTECDH
jgi:hypothetical protein